MHKRSSYKPFFIILYRANISNSAHKNSLLLPYNSIVDIFKSYIGGIQKIKKLKRQYNREGEHP